MKNFLIAASVGFLTGFFGAFLFFHYAEQKNLSAGTMISTLSSGTSTLPGVLNVTQANSTSTFSGGLAASYLNQTGTSATSTFARGINLAAGCFSIGNTCIGATTLDSLTDVVITSAAYGEVIMYNGSNWVDTATTTLFNTEPGNRYPSFAYATSTTWTGTTTRALGPAYIAETWTGAKCFTNVGTVDVFFTDGTNRMNFIQASTTVGTITLTTNNSFTAGEKRYVEFGNPATAPKEVSCTIYKKL